MRLIDADTLKNVVQWLNDCSTLGILAVIDELPTVDAVERKRGRWVRITDEVFADRFECSECGKLPPIENFEWWLSDYCPNCGADMRGEANE